MSLVVLDPGVHATVQDLGRQHFRAFGVPVGGAFDRQAHRLANALVGNPPAAATVELTLVGGTYQAECPLAIALAGAPLKAVLNEAEGGRRVLSIPQSCLLRQGDRLVLGGTPIGARTYLAVRGGWRSECVLGSRSTETPLQADDRLVASPSRTLARRPANGLVDDLNAENPLRIVDGPDAQLSLNRAWERLDFQVSAQSDRMGLRLEGPALEVPVDPNRLSAPVAPGALQVAGGRLVVLGVACGTMGGYPHVAQVISADLDRLGQVRPGQTLRFQRVTLSEARRLDEERRHRCRVRCRRITTLAEDWTRP